MSTYAPYGYQEVQVQDGAKKRPKLELDSPADGVVRCIFQMALLGTNTLDITKTLNWEGISSPKGSRWQKTTIHRILTNETYTGILAQEVVRGMREAASRGYFLGSDERGPAEFGLGYQ